MLPPDHAVDRIADQGTVTVRQTAEEALVERPLRRAERRLRASGDQHHGRTGRLQHLGEARVQRRVRRLVDQEIEADRGHPPRAQRGHEIGQKPAVDGRAEGQAGQRFLADRQDHDP